MLSKALAVPLSPRLRHFFWLEGMAAVCILGTLIVLAIGPRFLGYSSVVVYGGSMEPNIPKGSVAVGQPVNPNDIEPEDIIVYKLPGAGLPTLHRVMEIDRSGGIVRVRTKGDANQSMDPTEILLAGQGSRVVYSVPYVGYMLHAQHAAWSENLFVRLPALGLAVYFLWSIWKPEHKANPQRERLEARVRRIYRPYA
jgi:signal peptidase I